jgi:hypothetical protein
MSLPLQSVSIDNTRNQSTFPGHTFDFDVQPGCLHITAACLTFFKGTPSGYRSLNTRTFSPTAILDAHLFDGEANSEDENLWTRFFSKKLEWTEVARLIVNA